MKRILPLLLLCITSTLFAQQPSEALRLSWTQSYGSARQQAIGGAMTSLGGDVSATFVNPAGLAFYRTGEFAGTPLYRLTKNKSDYFNRRETASENNIGMGTTGFVLGGDNYSRNSKIKGSAFGIAVNGSANFRQEVLYRGANNQNSFSQRFIEQLGRRADSIDAIEGFPFGASLAFRSRWIDTVGGSGGNGSFLLQSRAAALLGAGGLLQENQVQYRGGITEIALGGAVNINNKWMLGGGIGVPLLRSRRTTTFTEADATENTANKFDFATLEEEVTINGTGVLARLGVIYKPQEFWRLGLAFQTPTVFTIRDEATATVTANTEGAGGIRSASSEQILGSSSPFNYGMVTPYRVSGSISYVIREIQDVTRQRGFITADVEYVNYKAASFFADSEDETTNDDLEDFFNGLNADIDRAYKGAFNFRLGGELKFTKWMVRLGGAYFGNPFKNLQGEKGDRLNLTGGLGYRHKGQFIDLSYVHSMSNEVQLPYRLAAGSPTANVRGRVGTVLLTYGVKLY